MSSTSPIDSQWELVDQILEALGFDKSAGEHICSFELRISVDEWPTVRMESKPRTLNGGTLTKIFEVHPVQMGEIVHEADPAIPEPPNIPLRPAVQAAMDTCCQQLAELNRGTVFENVCHCPTLIDGHRPGCPLAENS